MPLTSEFFVGHPRLHQVINGGPPLRPSREFGEHVQAVQNALIQLRIFGTMPLSTNFGTTVPDGIYGRETADTVAAFQKFNGLEPDGTVGPRTLSALDSAFPFATIFNVTDATTGAPLGFIFFDTNLATPPTRIGGWGWPTAPGFPGIRGQWFWSKALAPGQGSKPIQASQFSLILDSFLFPAGGPRLDAPATLWFGNPSQSLPINRWFPNRAIGTGTDHRGVDIKWTAISP